MNRHADKRSRTGLLLVVHSAFAGNNASIVGQRLGTRVGRTSRRERGGRSVRGVRALGGWDVRLIMDDLQMSGIVRIVTLLDGQGVVVTIFDIVLGNPGERAIVSRNLGSDGLDTVQVCRFTSA